MATFSGALKRFRVFLDMGKPPLEIVAYSSALFFPFRLRQNTQAFQSDVRVCCEGIIANGKSILDLLSLAAECGTMLALEAEGCDAEDAVAALANLISAQSHESEDKIGESVC